MIFLDKLIVKGGKKLCGSIEVPAAKNAILPLLAASVMLDGESKIKNCPNLSDIKCSVDIINSIGSFADINSNDICVMYRYSNDEEIPSDLCAKMRSSILYLAPLLYRKGQIKIYLPGGCNIGKRPIDIHLEGLREMGVQFVQNQDYIVANLKEGFKSCKFKLRLPSVGATQTLIMAAAVADGVTILKNCAREPEVVDLARFLNRAGAKIIGAGKSEVIIYGVSSLNAVEYEPIPDRIFAATVLSAINGCLGSCIIKNYPFEYMGDFEKYLKLTGLRIVHLGDTVLAFKFNHKKSVIKVHTGYYPSFPTDMGPLLSAAMVNNDGLLSLKETVFENRFSYCDEFKKLGVDCTCFAREYFQKKGSFAKKAVLYGKDLRAGAALVCASLAAKGEYEIYGTEYIDRGYEKIENIFSRLGADIRRSCE